MKKSLVWLLLGSSLMYAQNQGVGIGTLNPDPSARLEIVANDRGILIPRVNLVATNNPAPVTTPAISLLVYNLATINDVIQDTIIGMEHNGYDYQLVVAMLGY